jgi:monofunctional biosynthetic peptidoglycan transglycosylase
MPMTDIDFAAMLRRNRHSGPDLQLITPRVGRKRGFWARVKRRLLQLTLLFLLLPWLLVGCMRWVDPVYSSFMLGTRIERSVNKIPRRNIRYQWVDYEKISPSMRLAVIAAEDQKFAEHGGFDWKAIRRAYRHNGKGRAIIGASTISQQVAKNLFLWRSQSYLRKGIEAYLTVIIELLWPKQRILEVYLNIAQFGPRYFGVGAASKYYFNTVPARLNSSQAALLAAVLPSPTRYDAARPSRYVRSRQHSIQRQMNRLGGKYLAQIERTPPENRP